MGIIGCQSLSLLQFPHNLHKLIHTHSAEDQIINLTENHIIAVLVFGGRTLLTYKLDFILTVIVFQIDHHTHQADDIDFTGQNCKKHSAYAPEL